MNEPRGLPPYPPERNVWEFPPPPLSTRWRWAPIGLVTFAIAAASALGVAGVSLNDKDVPGFIDNDRLVSVIGRECKAMTSTIESMPVRGGRAQQARIVDQQDVVVEKMLAAIRRVDPAIRRADKPTDQWLSDWDRLVQARDEYAVLVSRGFNPDLRIPRDEAGHHIYVRMDDALLDQATCSVPLELLNPYPDGADDVSWDQAPAAAAFFFSCLKARTLASDSASTTSATDRKPFLP